MSVMTPAGGRSERLALRLFQIAVAAWAASCIVQDDRVRAAALAALALAALVTAARSPGALTAASERGDRWGALALGLLSVTVLAWLAGAVVEHVCQAIDPLSSWAEYVPETELPQTASWAWPGLALTLVAAGVASSRDRSRDRARSAAVACLACVVMLPWSLRTQFYPATSQACRSNQKILAGAIEMYNLDRNTKIAALDDDVLRALRSGGYLRTIPQDPWSRGKSYRHYRLTGSGIACTVHGALD